MEKETSTTRVRGNFTQNTKGIASIDITSEAPIVKKMKDLMNEAIDAILSTLKEKNIPVAHLVENSKEGK